MLGSIVSCLALPIAEWKKNCASEKNKLEEKVKILSTHNGMNHPEMQEKSENIFHFGGIFLGEIKKFQKWKLLTCPEITFFWGGEGGSCQNRQTDQRTDIAEVTLLQRQLKRFSETGHLSGFLSPIHGCADISTFLPGCFFFLPLTELWNKTRLCDFFLLIQNYWRSDRCGPVVISFDWRTFESGRWQEDPETNISSPVRRGCKEQFCVPRPAHYTWNKNTL